jgi:uncharacterized RDD family membrane protein YckC
MQSATTGGLLNKQELLKDIIRPTRRRKRLINYLIDVMFYYLILFSIGIVWGGFLLLTGSTSNEFQSDSFIWNVFFIGGLMAYYITFESIFGKTIGKMVTNTKVVMMDGSKPTFKKVVLRSFARIIPFDAFSFLSPNPRGWHDTLSDTLVIDDISLYSVGSKDVSQAKSEEGY